MSASKTISRTCIHREAPVICHSARSNAGNAEATPAVGQHQSPSQHRYLSLPPRLCRFPSSPHWTHQPSGPSWQPPQETGAHRQCSPSPVRDNDQSHYFTPRHRQLLKLAIQAHLRVTSGNATQTQRCVERWRYVRGSERGCATCLIQRHSVHFFVCVLNKLPSILVVLSLSEMIHHLLFHMVHYLRVLGLVAIVIGGLQQTDHLDEFDLVYVMHEYLRSCILLATLGHFLDSHVHLSLAGHL